MRKSTLVAVWFCAAAAVSAPVAVVHRKPQENSAVVLWSVAKVNFRATPLSWKLGCAACRNTLSHPLDQSALVCRTSLKVC